MSAVIRLPVPRAETDEPFRHVIDQYIHRARIVHCTCGLEFSSASPDGLGSPWERHVKANRPEGDKRR